MSKNVKVVILAGGLGSRLSEETVLKPKPLVEIGGKPILWHIMKYYSSYGFDDFIICCGYKGYLIKEYFANYFFHNSDLIFKTIDNSNTIINYPNEDWRVTVVDTGESTMTGGRIKRISQHVSDDDYFLCTYGDGLSDIDIKKLINFHLSNDCLATVSGVIPPARFGALVTTDNYVSGFEEKPDNFNNYINGGYFILKPEIFNYIENDSTIFERDPLEKLSLEKKLTCFKHNGFWKPMDTLREKNELEDLWYANKAPWKIWD